MPDPNTCSVCFDKFTKSTRAPTKCPHCGIEICRTCLQTYVLNDINDNPACVNIDCKHRWEREFLDGSFTRTFRLGTYKEHREKVLCDREKARLPATQQDASEYRIAEKIYKDTTKEMEEVEKQYNEIKQRREDLGTILANANEILANYGKADIVERIRQREENRRRERERQKQREAYHEAVKQARIRGEPAPPVPENTITDGAATEKKREVAAFVKPCPAPDCKGFLSTAWKCGLCDQYTCPDCHDLKGLNRDIEHTCDAEKVATARLISREAKNCPKCGVSICKIEGCDQMFCTQCNTGFDWRTGKIAAGPVHNPHYFAWLQAQGRNLANPITPAVAANGCETDAQVDRRVAVALTADRNEQQALMYGYRRRAANPPAGAVATPISDNQYLLEAWRLMREQQDQRRRDMNYDEEFRKLRVRYMMNQLTDADWKMTLQRHEKDQLYQQARQQIYELYVEACRDLIRTLLPVHAKVTLATVNVTRTTTAATRAVVTSDGEADVPDAVTTLEAEKLAAEQELAAEKTKVRKQVEELIEYCNKSAEAVSERFGRKVRGIRIQ